MGEKEIVLIVVLIVLAVFLHIFSVCGWYRRGFDEGYEKGLAPRKEPPIYGIKKTNNIVTLDFYYRETDFNNPNPILAEVELEDGIIEEIKPYIRKAKKETGYMGPQYHAQIKVVDERGEVLEQ